MNASHPPVDQVFSDALRRPAGAERAAFLDEVCGSNAELRERVDRLLRAHDDGASFLESPVVGSPLTVEPTLSERPGSQIGPYKLVQQIGEGGFGVVFLAEQERPVKRRVALKIIKPGMDTRQVIARFEAERQALALMDHPNIAKVYDAGTTQGEKGVRNLSPERPEGDFVQKVPDTFFLGRPYFVMELIQGVPITEYCDQCNLSARERLELFVSVCQAVQHAHQKGVIHRDIKPTNVLVAMHDGRPAPKIIDFGVAKAINQQLTEHTVMTAFAQIVGTPLYMSPEQAELSPLGVDTRSDIYSLGVLLYELLTGATPFDKGRLHSVPYDELRRIIREEEPPRPSARISTLAADLAETVAEHRRTDVRRLQQTVRGELDWIVMKALDKDRNRRYETANGLGRDIERYLNDEAVQACPPSVAYRLRKYIRRNKIAAAFILLLLAAVAALTVSNVQTRLSDRRANTENAKAQAISDLLQGMLRSANPDEAKDAQYTVRQLLDDFSDSFGDGLPDQPEVEAEIRATIGRAYWRLGAADNAEPHLTKALQLRRDLFGPNHEKVAEVLLDMAWCRMEQGRMREAETFAREAVQIYRDRNMAGAPSIQAHGVLQRVLVNSKRYDQADAVGEQALAMARDQDLEHADVAGILGGLADAQFERGNLSKAEQTARQAVEMNRRLRGPKHVETAWCTKLLGRILLKQQKYAEAEAELREARNIFGRHYRDGHYSVAGTVAALKQVLEANGDQAGLDALAQEEADEELRSDTGGHDIRMAKLLFEGQSTDHARKKKADEARRLIQSAMDAYSRVAVDYPRDLDRRLKAADGLLEVIRICAAHRDLERELEKAHSKQMEEFKALLVDFPDSAGCQEQVAHKLRLCALEFRHNSQYLSQAESAFDEAASLFEKLLRDNPDRALFWFCMANSHVHLGDVRRRLGKTGDAGAAYRRALEIYNARATDIAKKDPDNSYEMIADFFRLAKLPLTGRPQDKHEALHKFVGVITDEYRHVADDLAGDLNRRANALAGCAIAIGQCAQVPGFATEIEELNQHLETELPRLLADFPGSGDCLWQAALVYRRWATELLWDRDQLSTAELALRKATELHEALALSEPMRTNVWIIMADRYVLLSYLHWVLGKPQEAEAANRRAVEIFERKAADFEVDESEVVPGAIVIDSAWLAYYLGATNRKDEAAEFVRKAGLAAKRLTKPSESMQALYYIALLQIWLGDVAGYRETCQALVDVPAANADDSTKLITLLTWCLAPDAIADLSLPVKRAEEIAAHNAIDQPHFVPFNLGIALYRAGSYEEAAKRLEESIDAYPKNPTLMDQIVNWQRLFLAMTKWQLGEHDEARRLLAEAQLAIEEELRSPATFFEYRVTLEVLRREAEALITNPDPRTQSLIPNP